MELSRVWTDFILISETVTLFNDLLYILVYTA